MKQRYNGFQPFSCFKARLFTKKVRKGWYYCQMGENCGSFGFFAAVLVCKILEQLVVRLRNNSNRIVGFATAKKWNWVLCTFHIAWGRMARKRKSYTYHRNCPSSDLDSAKIFNCFNSESEKVDHVKVLKLFSATSKFSLRLFKIAINFYLYCSLRREFLFKLLADTCQRKDYILLTYYKIEDYFAHFFMSGLGVDSHLSHKRRCKWNNTLF